jgi:N6-adenosine-specific RNA methylase IME4
LRDLPELRQEWRRQRDQHALARTFVSDPPWAFKRKTGRGAAAPHYEGGTMSIEDICSYPLPPLARDARLFLWRVGAMQEEALAVIRAWGFKQKSEIVWIKTTQDGKPLVIDEDGDVLAGPRFNNLAWGNGFQTHYAHETCLIAVRGRPERTAHVRSVFFAPRGEHSEKPDRFYDIVNRMSPGPYYEQFARKRRTGWMTDGDELDHGSLQL